MRITLLGSGTVSRSLAAGFARSGHDLTLVTRDPSAASAAAWLAAAGPTARVGAIDAGAGEVVVFAVPGRALREVAARIDAPSLHGVIVIDPTNPILFDGDDVRSAFEDDDSGAQFLQRTFPAAHVVKAFNQIPAAQMASPDPEGGQPLRICGDDADAKATVTRLAEELGWRVRDLGPLARAGALERAAVDWIRSQRVT